MTICLAAKMVEGPIVTVSDCRISWGDAGIPHADDGTLKGALIADQWGLMFAGGDLRPIGGMLTAIRSQLRDFDKNEDVTLREGDVRRVVEGVYRQTFEDQLISERFSRYGFKSMEHFRKDGLAVFGPELLAKFTSEIDRHDLGLELLVYGFDEGPPYGSSHLFLVENPGVIRDCDVLGHAIIGTGHDPALSTLLRKRFKYPTVMEALWRLCEAKFAAEAAFAVGKQTTVIILCEDGSYHFLSPAGLQDIRALWEKEQRIGGPSEMFGIMASRLPKLLPHGLQKVEKIDIPEAPDT